MGTKIFDENSLYVKRFYGGPCRGTCFTIKIDREFTQKELCLMLSGIMDYIIVDGEGRNPPSNKEKI